METFLNLLIICGSIIGLWWGAVWVVESASLIAKKLGLSELVIGLTIVAIATSAPEFAVTVTAALKGQSSISVGNVVGSNIFNLGIILGIVALFRAVDTNRQIIYRDGLLLLGTTVLLLVFFSDLRLTFTEGVLLFLTIIVYIVTLIKQKQKIEDEIPGGEFKWYDIPKLIVGVAVIIFAADYLVFGASNIALMFGVSEWMIGITIVAAGTSVPELATSMIALFKGRHGISIGNLIGSDLFNTLGVLGVAAILRPLPIMQNEYTSIILMSINVFIILFFMRTGWQIKRYEAVLLILIAFVRWYWDFIF